MNRQPDATITPPEAAAAPDQNNGPSENKPEKSLWRRMLWAFLLGLLLLVAAVAGAAAWLAATESGLRYGLYKIPSWFGVNISSKTLQGTLWKGFHGDGWRVETEGADIGITRFSFDWNPRELTQSKLHIKHLIAGDIQIVTKPVPPSEKKPASGLPESVSLPVEVALDKLETGKISVGSRVDRHAGNAQVARLAGQVGFELFGFAGNVAFGG